MYKTDRESWATKGRIVQKSLAPLWVHRTHTEEWCNLDGVLDPNSWPDELSCEARNKHHYAFTLDACSVFSRFLLKQI